MPTRGLFNGPLIARERPRRSGNVGSVRQALLSRNFRSNNGHGVEWPNVADTELWIEILRLRILFMAATFSLCLGLRVAGSGCSPSRRGSDLIL